MRGMAARTSISSFGIYSFCFPLWPSRLTGTSLMSTLWFWASASGRPFMWRLPGGLATQQHSPTPWQPVKCLISPLESRPSRGCRLCPKRLTFRVICCDIDAQPPPGDPHRFCNGVRNLKLPWVQVWEPLNRKPLPHADDPRMGHLSSNLPRCPRGLSRG